MIRGLFEFFVLELQRIISNGLRDRIRFIQIYVVDQIVDVSCFDDLAFDVA